MSHSSFTSKLVDCSWRLALLALPVWQLAAEGGAPPPPATPGGGGGGGAEGSPLGAMMPMLIVMGVLVLIMWSGVRKQKREQKEHQSMVDNMKTGQEVITAGGIHGEVVRKGETTVDVRTGGKDGAIITFGLNAITKIVTDDDAGVTPADS